MDRIGNPEQIILDTQKIIQSRRTYEAAPAIKNLGDSRIIFERLITPDTKVCLIGDGQGMDTDQFLKMGVKPENIQSINYEPDEVKQANQNVLAKSGVEMKQGDATSFENLLGAGIGEASQEIVTLMHVLEVPNIKDETEKRLVANIIKILKAGGELLVSQYKHKFTKDERSLQEKYGIEKIKAEDLQKQFGDNWKAKFKDEYGIDWEEDMRYGEISNIRTKEELIGLFENFFDIKFEETETEFILKMKKRAKT